MSLAIDARFARQVLRDEPLSRHTSWHVGGPADRVLHAARSRRADRFPARTAGRSTPLLWLGLGSNLLVRDGGIRGVVIATARRARRGSSDAATSACTPRPACRARWSRASSPRWELGPAAFLAGIPGTFGGALAMNAGAFGGETWPLVRSVETVDRRGSLRERAASEYRDRLSQRRAAGRRDEWFLAATLRTRAGDGADETSIRTLLERRRQTQPIGERSCGSRVHAIRRAITRRG